MIVDDIKLSKRKTDPRLMQIISQVVEIINGGLYESKTFTSAPTSSSPGFEGETRVVKTGVTVRIYRYLSGAWYYSGTYTAA